MEQSGISSATDRSTNLELAVRACVCVGVWGAQGSEIDTVTRSRHSSQATCTAWTVCVWDGEGG
jgi:hypothetical protein